MQGECIQMSVEKGGEIISTRGGEAASNGKKGHPYIGTHCTQLHQCLITQQISNFQ